MRHLCWILERNWAETRIVPSLFFNLANPFPNGSVFACSAAESGVAMKRKAVKTELFRVWLSQHGVLALQ